MSRSEKLAQLVRQGGVAHSLRARIWPRLCTAATKRSEATVTYRDLVHGAKNMANRRAVTKQIEKVNDLSWHNVNFLL